MKREGWKESYKRPDVFWTVKKCSSTNEEMRDKYSKKNLCISKIPGITDVCPKSIFSRIMSFWAKIRPKQFSFIPRTY